MRTQIDLKDLGFSPAEILEMQKSEQWDKKLERWKRSGAGFLEMPLPIGKRLCDCTWGEVRRSEELTTLWGHLSEKAASRLDAHLKRMKS